MIGGLGGVLCNYGCKIKDVVGLDDALDVFGVHGVGGVFGAIVSALFAQSWVNRLDGSVSPGGWINGNYILMGYQLIGIGN